MPFTTRFAETDENVLDGNVPEAATIGRQFKRLRTAEILEDHLDAATVNEAVIGDRATALVDLTIRRLANEDPGAPIVALIQKAVTEAIKDACAPGGAISHAIIAACTPNGPVATAITAACAPGAAISNAITAACAPGGAVTNAITGACAPAGAVTNTISRLIGVSERRQIARLKNQAIGSGTGTLFPLPDTNGEVPDLFPTTVDEFWAVNGPLADQLLEAYCLPEGGTLAAKKKRLAQFCGIRYPL